MSDHAASSAAVAGEPGLLKKHHFLLRRLHSLSGILPVGLFVCMHLFTNASMIGSLFGRPDLFQHEVDFIHSMPALEAIEIALWLSIGFHAVLGVMYMTGIAPNTMHYKYQDNFRYTLQRITAWIALVFILLHIATLRWRFNFFDVWHTPFWHRMDFTPSGGVEAAHEGGIPMSLPLTAYALQFSWLVVLFYVVGVLGVVFHWSNGLWTAAITWGLTVTEPAMKRWGYVCLALGLALTFAFGGAIVGAMGYDLAEDTSPDQRLVLDKITKGEWRARVGTPSAESDVAGTADADAHTDTANDEHTVEPETNDETAY